MFGRYSQPRCILSHRQLTNNVLEFPDKIFRAYLGLFEKVLPEFLLKVIKHCRYAFSGHVIRLLGLLLDSIHFRLRPFNFQRPVAPDIRLSAMFNHAMLILPNGLFPVDRAPLADWDAI
jgi:hypothetical protein